LFCGFSKQVCLFQEVVLKKYLYQKLIWGYLDACMKILFSQGVVTQTTFFYKKKSLFPKAYLNHLHLMQTITKLKSNPKPLFRKQKIEVLKHHKISPLCISNLKSNPQPYFFKSKILNFKTS
jgi:hypothetical protein